MKVVEATEVKGRMSEDAAKEVKFLFFVTALQIDKLAKKHELDQNGIMCTLMCLMWDFLKKEGMDVDAVLKTWRGMK